MNIKENREMLIGLGVIGFIAPILSLIIVSSRNFDPIVVSKVYADPYEFTKNYKPMQPPTLTPQEKETVELIKKVVDLSSKGKSFNSTEIKNLLQKNDATISKSEIFVVKLNDGSNVMMESDKYSSPSRFELNVHNLSANQCREIQQHYEVKQDIVPSVEKFIVTNGFIGYQDSQCDLDHFVKLSYKPNYASYNINELKNNIPLALKSYTNRDNFKEEEFRLNVLFSKELSNEMFLRNKYKYKNVEYVVNPEAKKVYLGGLSYQDCKAIVYKGYAKPLAGKCTPNTYNLMEATI